MGLFDWLRSKKNAEKDCWIELYYEVPTLGEEPEHYEALIDASGWFDDRINQPYAGPSGLDRTFGIHRLSRYFDGRIESIEGRYTLFITPHKPYDVQSLLADSRILYKIAKDSTLGAGFAFTIHYREDLDTENDVLMVTQTCGFLTMRYPLELRADLFRWDPDRDMECFMEQGLDTLLPAMIYYAEDRKEQRLKEKLEAVLERIK